MAAAPRQIYSRPPLDRINHIYAELKRGRHPNARKLARELEVNPRTVIRDLDFMRDRLKLPIEYDPRRYGYFFTRPVERFPLLHVNQSEIFALAVAHNALALYRGTPFERPLRSAFRKLTAQLGDDAAYSISGLEAGFSFRPFAPEDTDLETFELLSRAIQQRRAVKFLYRNLGAERGQRRHARPCHLTCIDNTWYLFAHDVDRAAMRTFNLTRLSHPEPTGETFAPIRFDLEKHLRGGFKAFVGTDDFEIVLLFNRWGADLVRGHQWHHSQELTELAGGRLRVRLRLNNIYEIERFVLGFGEHVTIERPAKLRARLREIGQHLLERYREDVDAPDSPQSSSTTRNLL